MKITRRKVVQGFGAMVASGLATAAYGFGIEAPSTRITTYRLTPPGWRKGQRLTAAIITDLHVLEPWMGVARLRKIVDTTNAMGVDIILLLGDFGAGYQIRRLGRKIEARVWAAELARLKAPLGVHAVLGNHDWWDDPAAQSRKAGPTQAHVALAAVGIPVLDNKAVRFGRGDTAFWLAGLGDQWAFFTKERARLGRGRGYLGVDDLPGTLAQVTDDAPIILMAHEPDIFPVVPSRVSLTLSGHTHGGQISLFGYTPIVPSRFGSKYVYGHIEEYGRHLIVSAGLGCSGLPLRLGAPPEIVRVELGA